MRVVRSIAVALLSSWCVYAVAQNAPAAPPDAPAPAQKTMQNRPPRTPAEEAEAKRVKGLAVINGVPYQRPSNHDFFMDYVRDSYGLPALGRTTVRALYSEGVDKPSQWGQDAAGFGQRFGSSAGITVISGNVRYGMEMLFHEDLRYYPCHGCDVKHKIENALLAEITARHDTDGHRFFTLTPTVADFSGPIVAHTIWYPGNSEGPLAGVISARVSFATRIGAHLFQEFVLERRHRHDPETHAPIENQKKQ